MIRVVKIGQTWIQNPFPVHIPIAFCDSVIWANNNGSDFKKLAWIKQAAKVPSVPLKVEFGYEDGSISS